MRIAILDDYSNAALGAADWSALDGVTIERLAPSLMATEDARRESLLPFEIVVAMRERTAFSADLLSSLPNLKLLITTGMRNNSIDMAAARLAGIDVCGTKMTSYAAFEHTWALLMSIAKNVPAEHQAMATGAWQQHTGVGLSGKTLGVVGLGKLGSQTAAAGRLFGMDVIAWSQNLTPEGAREKGATRVDKETLFREADFICIHMVLSDRTRGLVDVDALALMKPTAYLINTSRGPLVDEAALIRALSNKSIGGAALDVYDTEPLPPDHALRSLDNVVLTGHTGYVIQEMFEIAYGQAVECIANWQSGTPLRVLNAD